HAMYPVHGAFASVNGLRQMLLHFYVEYPSMPESATVEARITDGNVEMIGQTLNIKNPESITREIVATISVPIEVALPLAKIIQDQPKKFNL
ncbi:MAG TPA: hypothetical protein VMI53_06615, partial [Opitutaceae bacterium]|nr:hypothetical protein [Opitutaceae bacterium]